MTKGQMSNNMKYSLAGIFIFNLLYLSALFLAGCYLLLDEDIQDLWTSAIWVVIKVSHVVLGLIFIVLGIIITKQIYNSYEQEGLIMTNNGRKELRMLWIVIITNLIDAVLELIWNIIILAINPDNCYDLFSNEASNIITLWIFKSLSLNIWIWPILYVFNSRHIVKYQIKSELQAEKDATYDQFATVYMKSNSNNKIDVEEALSRSNVRSMEVPYGTTINLDDEATSIESGRSKIVFSELGD